MNQIGYIWSQLTHDQRLRVWGATGGLWLAVHLLGLIGLTLWAPASIIGQGGLWLTLSLSWPLLGLALINLVFWGSAPRLAYGLACLIYAVGWLFLWPGLSLPILALGYLGEKTVLLIGLENRWVWPWNPWDISDLQAALPTDDSPEEAQTAPQISVDLGPPQPEDKDRLGIQGKIGRRKLELNYQLKQQQLQQARRQGELKPVAYQQARRELELSYRRLYTRWEEGRVRFLARRRAQAPVIKPGSVERDRIEIRLVTKALELSQLNQKIRDERHYQAAIEGHHNYSRGRELWEYICLYDFMYDDEEEESGCFFTLISFALALGVMVWLGSVGVVFGGWTLPVYFFFVWVIRYLNNILAFVPYLLSFRPPYYESSLEQEFEAQRAELQTLKTQRTELRREIAILRRQVNLNRQSAVFKAHRPLLFIGVFNLFFLGIWLWVVWLTHAF